MNTPTTKIAPIACESIDDLEKKFQDALEYTRLALASKFDLMPLEHQETALAITDVKEWRQTYSHVLNTHLDTRY